MGPKWATHPVEGALSFLLNKEGSSWKQTLGRACIHRHLYVSLTCKSNTCPSH